MFFNAIYYMPRSDEFVYQPAGDLTHLMTGKLDGSPPRTLFVSPRPMILYSISPDATRVRFAEHYKLWECRLDGSGMHRIVPDRIGSYGHWTPDGKLYAFLTEDANGNNLIWAITETRIGGHVIATRSSQLTAGPVPFTWFTPSKDGKQIFAMGETMRGELNRYDPASGEFRPFLNGFSAGEVNYSRDGQWIAYITHPDGAVWRSRADGSDPQQLTYPDGATLGRVGAALNPQWSPDGRFIVYAEMGLYSRKILLLPVDGGSPLLLASGEFRPADPTWSPDGKSIAYGGAGGAGKSTDIRVLKLETRQSQTIAGSESLFSPRWSPDGNYIAAVSEDSLRLLLYNFAAGSWTQLALPDMSKSATVGWPSWSHDGRYLYAMIGEGIYRIRVPDGKPELVVTTAGLDARSPATGWDGGFWLTPDDRILIMRDRGVDELYALDLEYR